MTVKMIEPYLFFGGRCEEALAFYQAAIGAKVNMVMLYNQSPTPPPAGILPPGFESKVMHASFTIGQSIIMASDGCEVDTKFNGFRLSLAVTTAAEADRVFAALSDGGTIQMPLAKTFWSPLFGMLTDRFGLGWMVTVEAEEGK